MQRGHGSRTVARRFSGSPDASPALDQQPSSQLLRGSLQLQSAADGGASAFPTQKNLLSEAAGSFLGGSRRGGGGGDDAMSLDDAGDVGQRPAAACLQVLLADDQHEGAGSLQLGTAAAGNGTGTGPHHQAGGGGGGNEGAAAGAHPGAAGDEEVEGEGHAAAEPPAEPPSGPMTDTIMTGLPLLCRRWPACSTVAVDFLEAMKKDFVERMTRSLGLNAGHPDGAAGLLQDLEGGGRAEGDGQ